MKTEATTWLIDKESAGSPLRRTSASHNPVLLGIGLIIIALNLRTLFSSFSAVLPEINAYATLPGWAVNLLTTVPVTFLGLLAPICPHSHSREDLGWKGCWPGRCWC